MENSGLSLTQIEDYIKCLSLDIEKFRRLKRDLILLKIKSCPHKPDSVIEGDYRENYFSNADAPFRVCKDCGYAEEGWGCGHYLLRPQDYYNCPKVDRNTALSYVRVFLRQSEGLAEVIVKRKKLNDLLDEVCKV